MSETTNYYLKHLADGGIQILAHVEKENSVAAVFVKLREQKSVAVFVYDLDEARREDGIGHCVYDNRRFNLNQTELARAYWCKVVTGWGKELTGNAILPIDIELETESIKFCAHYSDDCPLCEQKALTEVARINKGFSGDFFYRIPYVTARLTCGHDIEMPLVDASGNRHDPANWLLKAGAKVECPACTRNVAAIEKMIEISRAPGFSHITLRDLTASGTRDWMTFCAYATDADSPSQCRLVATCEATASTEQALRDAGVRFIPGPSRGRNAML